MTRKMVSKGMSITMIPKAKGPDHKQTTDVVLTLHGKPLAGIKYYVKDKDDPFTSGKEGLYGWGQTVLDGKIHQVKVELREIG